MGFNAGANATESLYPIAQIRANGFSGALPGANRDSGEGSEIAAKRLLTSAMKKCDGVTAAPFVGS